MISFWTYPGLVEGWLPSTYTQPLPTFASAGRRPAYGTSQPPALPTGRPSSDRAERGARDVDLEDLAGMSDDEVPDPLGHGRPPAGDRMLA
jgi:hypothetical protein